MRVSWGEDYAVIFMDALAKSYQKRLVSLSEISRKNQISHGFLKQLSVKLKRKKLIKSKEGVGGGYELAKNPKNISLLDIVSAINKHWNLTYCCHLSGGTPHTCPREGNCPTRNTWQRVNQELADKLKTISLQSL